MVRRARLKTKNNKSRQLTILLFILFLSGLTAWGGWTYRKELQTLADVWKETSPDSEIPANNVRGTIYDRNFKELAHTLERVSLYARPREIADLPGTAERLSELLGLPESELQQKLNHPSHLVWLRRDIGQEDEMEIRSAALPGIYLHRELIRTYPGQKAGAHLVGYAENEVGLIGIEHYYNNPLSHNRVRREDLPQVDFNGERETQGNGHDLVLTVDLKIQTILDEYVSELGKNLGNVQIASLLLETSKGKIVAGANFPSFNPNGIWQYENTVLENILLTPMAVPDVIRRFFLQASYLQGGWEQSTQVYPWSLVNGTTEYAGQLRCWERIQLNADVKVDLSGGEKYENTIPEYVACQPTPNMGTVPGILPPVQVLLGFTHLINGGKRIQPHFLDRMLEKPSQKEYLYDAFQGEQGGMNVLPALVSAELQNLLQSQGIQGTLGAVSLAGNTLSRIADSAGFSYVDDWMSLTAIPAEKPELVLLLVVRKKEMGPRLQKDSIQDYLSTGIDAIIPPMVALQQVHANFSDLLELEKKTDENFQAVSREVDRGKTLAGMLDEQILLMPDLTGMSLRKGLRLLQKAELEIHVQGSGRIVSQKPPVGKLLEKGGQCLLVLQKDPAPENVIDVHDSAVDGK